jgi:hypothetical protein
MRCWSLVFPEPFFSVIADLLFSFPPERLIFLSVMVWAPFFPFLPDAVPPEILIFLSAMVRTLLFSSLPDGITAVERVPVVSWIDGEFEFTDFEGRFWVGLSLERGYCEADFCKRFFSFSFSDDVDAMGCENLAKAGSKVFYLGILFHSFNFFILKYCFINFLVYFMNMDVDIEKNMGHH